MVNFHTTATAETATTDQDLSADGNQFTVSGTALGADDFTIIAYNKFGGHGCRY